MESHFEYSFPNTVEQASILVCKENFASYENEVAGSEFLIVTDDQIAVDKTLVVQKTMIIKERTVLSMIQNESAVNTVPRPQPSTLISQSRPQTSSQNGNLTDEMEICSQNSFMELCSQESTEKMDICSQESIVSRMDLGSQENVLKVEDCVSDDSKSDKISVIILEECQNADLKRKHASSITDESSTDICEKVSDILVKGEIGLCEAFENVQDHLSIDPQNHTSQYKVHEKKRLKK